MVDSGIGEQTLEVFSSAQRIKQIDDPCSKTILDWVRQLDGKRVTDLVVTSPQGWLTVGVLGDQMSICASDWTFAVCQSEIVSRPRVVDKLLRHLRHQGYQ